MSHLVQIHQSNSSPGLEHDSAFPLQHLCVREPRGVVLGGSGYSVERSSVGGLSVCKRVWRHAGPMLLVCVCERAAVRLRAMYRRSPCHKGRIYFDFSEEVVKRLHASAFRSEHVHSHFPPSHSAFHQKSTRHKRAFASGFLFVSVTVGFTCLSPTFTLPLFL